jgi:hypothetical protein
LPVGEEVGRVRYRFVSAKWNIEFSALIEPAETVEASAIKIIEKLGRLRRSFTLSCEFIKTLTLFVEHFFIVFHFNVQLEAFLNLTIEIYEMRVNVVEYCKPGLKTKRNCEAAAKRFNISSIVMRLPEMRDVRRKPAFATSPFERRFEI